MQRKQDLHLLYVFQAGHVDTVLHHLKKKYKTVDQAKEAIEINYIEDQTCDDQIVVSTSKESIIGSRNPKQRSELLNKTIHCSHERHRHAR